MCRRRLKNGTAKDRWQSPEVLTLTSLKQGWVFSSLTKAKLRVKLAMRLLLCAVSSFVLGTA